MHLPNSERVPTAILSAVFSNTSATYKFYWFLALLESVERGETHIPKKRLFAGMIAQAWYTVNYFHLSFGKQDLIHQTAGALIATEQLTVDIDKREVSAILEHSQNKDTIRLLQHFNKNVPHWFLSPWFQKDSHAAENDTAYRNRIYAASRNFENACLYALYEDTVTFNPAWLDYLRENTRVLKDYCYWNLANFLQSRNPNVPDINGKLIKPPFRGTLQAQRKNYWDIVFKELGTIDCIFTANRLRIDNYALDHFIPYAFVAHDLIWNLIPIDQHFNSCKSDRLPPIELYFDKFFSVQKQALEVILHNMPKNRLLEEYFTIFPTLAKAEDFDYTMLRDTIQPISAIAHNNGFLYLS